MDLTIEQTLQQGVVAHKDGKLQDAARLYRAILQSQPLHPDANHNLGVLAVSMNKTAVALPLFKVALKANPKIEQFWLSYIQALIKEKQFDNAKAVLKQAKKQGVAEEKLNALEAQVPPKIQIENVNSASPSQQQLNSLLEYYQNRRFNEAEKLAVEINQEFPKHQFAWKVLGAVLGATGRKSEAVDANQTAVALSPQDASAHSNLGNALKELGRLDEALESYKQAIALKPDFPEAHCNLGNLLQELGRLDEALESFSQAIALKPDFFGAHSNLGFTLHELGRLDEAEASYTQAIALKPDFALVHYNLGNTLKELGRLEDAGSSYKQAIMLKTGFSEAHQKLAITQRELGNIGRAIQSERYEIFLNSPNVEASELENLPDNLPFRQPSPLEYPALYRAGMGTENVGGFLRAMAQMLRPKNVLEIGAGYTTPFLLEALINNERVYDDGNLEPSYFKDYVYDSKLVVIDNMSLGELSKKPEMDNIISSKYIDFVEGNFEGKAGILGEKYGDFDFVWFDCGGIAEYQTFMDEYWSICSDYIFFHFTYSSGSPNELRDIILNNVTGNPSIFDIVEPHKSRQGSITMIRKK